MSFKTASIHSKPSDPRVSRSDDSPICYWVSDNLTLTSALVPHWPNFLLIISSTRLVDLFKCARHSGFKWFSIFQNVSKKLKTGYFHIEKVPMKTVLVIMPSAHVYKSMINWTNSICIWVTEISRLKRYSLSVRKFRVSMWWSTMAQSPWLKLKTCHPVLGDIADQTI